MIPPPTAITKSDLLKLFDNNFSNKKFTVLMDLFFSLNLILILKDYILKFFLMKLRIFFGTFLSTTKAIFFVFGQIRLIF